MVNTHKFGVSISLWIVSSIIGMIPIFFEFVNWYLEQTTDITTGSFLEHFLVTHDLYFGLASVLISSLIELVLETGNRYTPLVFINIIVNILALILYNLCYFKHEFLCRIFSNSSGEIMESPICWFFVIVFFVAIMIGLINILFLSFDNSNTLMAKKHIKQSNRVKVY